MKKFLFVLICYFPNGGYTHANTEITATGTSLAVVKEIEERAKSIVPDCSKAIVINIIQLDS